MSEESEDCENCEKQPVVSAVAAGHIAFNL